MDELTKTIIKKYPKSLILFEIVYMDGTGSWVKMTGDERLSIGESASVGIDTIKCHPNNPTIWDSMQCVFFTDIQNVSEILNWFKGCIRCDNCMDWFCPTDDEADCIKCFNNDEVYGNLDELTPQDADPGEPDDREAKKFKFVADAELSRMISFLNEMKEDSCHSEESELLIDKIKEYLRLGWRAKLSDIMEGKT